MTFVAINPLRRFAAPFLSFLLAYAPGAGAQQPPPPAQVKPIAPLPTTESLKLIVLAGQKEQNDLQRHLMAPLVVQVVDQSDNPVEGADVVFRFPFAGPSATFEGQKTAQSFRSDAQGQARATNWTANYQTGNFKVSVTATLGNQMGQTTVSMSNAIRVSDQRRRGHGWWTPTKVAILVIAGAAGVAAGILLTRNSTSGPTTVTISTGAPTLGGPH
jgi:hypothetical protein